MALNTVVISKNTSTVKTLDLIKQLSKDGMKNKTLQKVASILEKSSDPIKGVFDFAYNTAVYFPDPDGRQIIQPVEVTLRDGIANCVDYSVLQSSLLRIMGISHMYRRVSFDRSKDYDHIYIVADKKILDPVIGQKQDGTQKRIGRTPFYNKEVSYTHKSDTPVASLEIMQGIKENEIATVARAVRTRTGASRVGFLGYSNALKKHYPNQAKELGSVDWGSIFQALPSVISTATNIINPQQQQAAQQQQVMQQQQAIQQAEQQKQNSSSSIDTNTILMVLGGGALIGGGLYLATRGKKSKR
jgi:LPXTG-motif cell wall-anchored protein